MCLKIFVMNLIIRRKIICGFLLKGFPCKSLCLIVLMWWWLLDAWFHLLLWWKIVMVITTWFFIDKMFWNDKFSIMLIQLPPLSVIFGITIPKGCLQPLPHPWFLLPFLKLTCSIFPLLHFTKGFWHLWKHYQTLLVINGNTTTWKKS